MSNLEKKRKRAEFITATKDVEITRPELVIDANDPRKYQFLCDAYYQQFMENYLGVGAESTPIQFGFSVVTQILAQVPRAYAEYLVSVGQPKNHIELLDCLLASYEKVVPPLAKTDKRRVTTYEQTLGIRGTVQPTAATTSSFEFVTTSEGLTYRPERIKFAQAQIEVAGRELAGDLDPLKPEDKCPALTFILPKVWAAMATDCVVTYELFGSDVTDELHRLKFQKLREAPLLNEVVHHG